MADSQTGEPELHIRLALDQQIPEFLKFLFRRDDLSFIIIDIDDVFSLFLLESELRFEVLHFLRLEQLVSNGFGLLPFVFVHHKSQELFGVIAAQDVRELLQLLPFFLLFYALRLSFLPTLAHSQSSVVLEFQLSQG
jgi:hypothetical protein